MYKSGALEVHREFLEHSGALDNAISPQARSCRAQIRHEVNAHWPSSSGRYGRRYHGQEAILTTTHNECQLAGALQCRDSTMGMINYVQRLLALDARYSLWFQPLMRACWGRDSLRVIVMSLSCQQRGMQVVRRDDLPHLIEKFLEQYDHHSV